MATFQGQKYNYGIEFMTHMKDAKKIILEESTKE